MKIGICADSHDHLPNLRRAMLEFRRRGAEAVVHAGDFIAPFTIDAMKLAGCPIHAVYGNNDGETAGLAARFTEIGELWREPHLYDLGGVRIVVMHHPEWVGAFARPGLVDIIVFGHTHEVEIENRPPWIINPGEVFGGLSRRPTAVWYDSEVGRPELIELTGLPDQPGTVQGEA